MRNFLKFQIKFTEKFHEMVSLGTGSESLKFLKYKSHQLIVNEYLQTSFFRYGLYSITEFDIEANRLDYNIGACNYPDYEMLSDVIEDKAIEEITANLDYKKYDATKI